MKCSSKMLQNLPYYMYIYENPKLLFPFFISCYFIISLINALVYVDIDQDINLVTFTMRTVEMTYIKISHV